MSFHEISINISGLFLSMGSLQKDGIQMVTMPSRVIQLQTWIGVVIK